MKLVCLFLVLFASEAFAHKPSDSYLRLTPSADGFTGDWRISVRDLDAAIGVDGDGDRRITWGELRGRHVAVVDYALSRLRISSAGESCTLSAGEQLVEELSDGAYTVMPVTARCPSSVSAWTLDYSLLFDIDPTHRGLLTTGADQQPQTFVLSPDSRQAALSLSSSPSPSPTDRSSQFVRMLKEGVHHIWSGFDHLLFLAALLLPAGLRASRESPRFRPLLKEVLWLVSAFTVAHSITLSLAALRLVSLPPRLIETAIAVSIVVAGLRLRRSGAGPAIWIAFGFGLLHGFGFANVLYDMQLPQGALATSLFAFNLGVELGQCAIVAAVLPLLWRAQRFSAYRRVFLPSAAVLIVAIGVAWTIERGAGVNLLALAAQ